MLVDHFVDTVVLAFVRPDRSEFFGPLGTCQDHGVATMVHRRHADSVHTNEFGAGDLVRVDLTPWDPQDRLFDVAVAALAPTVPAPLLIAMAAAISLEDRGPVLECHERIAAFGGRYAVYEFRTGRVEESTGGWPGRAESIAGGDEPPVEPDVSWVEPPECTAESPECTTGWTARTGTCDVVVGDRSSRIGAVLNWTHLATLPRLWSVLVGVVSVVGPRPVRPDLDTERGTATGEWRRRWFVRPGLTGLARVESGPAASPKDKLRYDLRYIRRQSFRFDLRIVLRRVVQAI